MEYSYTDNIKFFGFRNSELYKKASDEKQKAFDALMEIFTNNDLMGKEVRTKNAINFIKAKYNELAGISKFEAITILRICDVRSDKITKFTDIFDLISEWDMNTDLAEKLIESERPSDVELPKLKRILK